MPGFLIRNWLPRRLRAPLWGDRDKWGLIAQEDDPCWLEWERRQLEFYDATQREGAGTRVNDAGYEIMADIDMDGRRVLEIGPGDIRHIRFWRGRPAEYLLADLRAGMLKKAEARLDTAKVSHQSILLTRHEPLPVGDSSVDIVVSFYSLEHIYPLAPLLDELERVLKPGGAVIGAIPTEGGFAWGLGRALTSRRWFKRNTSIDPDKIICWEHPNFADNVLAELDESFERKKLTFWPFSVLPLIDANLIIRFVYLKRASA